MSHRPLLAVATLLMTSLSMGSLDAATDTSTLTVTATVKTNCDVSGGTLAFGDYVSGQPGNADATGSFQIANCPNATVKLELDGGSTGNATDRRMSFGTNSLRYQVYKDAARSQAWATGTGGLDLTLPATSPTSVSVYGRIPGAQTVAPGNYTDTVTITMTF